MTKNNLNSSLSWLLQHPHSFGSLGHISVIADTASISYDESEAADANEEMARLQLAPQIPPRPKLHTQLQRDPNPLPTPTPSRPSVDSKPQSNLSKKQGTPSVYRQSPKPRTPVTSFDDIKFDDSIDVLDIDEIDLTGDVTTSSFGEFGPPTQLWNERSACRVGPTPKKKGKKRKSDEYESDLLSPRSSRKSTKVVQQRATTIASPTRGSQTSVTEKTIEEEISLTQTTTRPRVATAELDTFLDRGADAIEGGPNYQRKVTENTHQPQASTRPLQTRTQRSQNVVPDSDDDEDPPPAQKLESDAFSRAYLKEGHGLGPDGLAAKEEDAERVFRSPARSQLLSVRESPGPADSVRAKSTLTPQRTSNPDVIFNNGTPTLSITGNLTLEQKKLVDSFVMNGKDQLQSLVQRLEDSKKVVVRQILEEMCEHGAASSQLKERQKAIANKIIAATRLQDESTTLFKLRNQREQMVIQKDKLYKAGHVIEPDDPEDVLTLLCQKIFKAKREIDARELTVFSLLEHVGVSTSNGMRDHEKIDRDSLLSPGPKLSNQKVLVASTQKPPQSTSKNAKSETPQGLSHLSTQSIRQTPSFYREDATDMAIKSSNRTPSPYRESPKRSQVSEFPKIKHSTPHAFDTSDPSRVLASVSAKATVGDFSRTMGSPARDFSFDDEDFEEGLDDEEMYKAVEQYEQNLPFITATSPDRGERSVLREVSDNIRRKSPPKPATTSSTPRPPPAALMQHPWSKEVFSTLRKKFHLQEFRHNQLEAINATLSGKDAFVLMPTGGGKSLCYQLPAVVQSGRTAGVTIVVSPLLSLMQDQVDHLQKLHVQAVLVNGQTSQEHRNYILQALRSSEPEKFVQLLYVTPEMLNKSETFFKAFLDLNKRRLLARIVIDEAHCVSQWGHDFRPDYKAVGEVRRRFMNVPVMALTATATENVKVDCMHNLGMDGAEVFTQSFNRPNLTYEVRPKGGKQAVLASIAGLIQESYKGQAGIIYCLSRKACEDVAKQLQEEYDIQARHYHAGLEPPERIHIQKEWQAGKYKVIVATIAFGMGIDKPDVRFVIHHTIPKSLEGYYQETGRAGRDGGRAGCYLYYGYGDTTSIKRMIDKGDGDWQQKERQKHLLRNVVQFCENRSDCRRQQVLGYFNEHFKREDCNNTCDNCNSTSTFETQDFSEHAKNAIRIVQQVSREQVTLLHCVDVYRGGKTKKISELSHNRLREYGMGADLARGDVERLFYRLISEDALVEYNKVNTAGFATQYVKTGPRAPEFEAGRGALSMQILISPKDKTKSKAGASKAKKKTQRAGAKAAADDYPASTNVSSPLQPRSRRIPPRAQFDEDSDEVEEEDDDGFYFDSMPAISGRRPNRRVGPPITTDDRTEGLDEIHQHILDDFVDNAKKEIKRIQIAKGLRQASISDLILREIATHFPRDENALRDICRMNEEKFQMFGPVLLRLVKSAYNDYKAMKEATGEDVGAPHDRSIVEISDDEDGDRVDESDEELDETESSHYFSVADDVSQFNEKLSQASAFATRAPKTAPKKRISRPKSVPWSHRTSRGSQQRGGGSSRGRTTATKGKRGSGGITKKAKSSVSARSSTSNSGMQEYVYNNSKEASSNRNRGGGAGKISMMPT
ncbi:uncharacterized protein Z520_05770 [Fonsecaea multimorphosa CBS 102226]|uniref:DNA 3'-5' helicase n=1 Tax=Fonsecaea multimorphosa CBS 102226 TaxID=1442371 RepID=A0A0D2K5P2_9EURO|nr:uncharacterized protein Z520_05770 [Fonsecaea multimorphosa CBS 102226]KIX98469.1 hypothetical protein Z520_05770 [Fonsecaea multimorphosa CBS 102226]OAL24665.1 hypothetical protein AYO22_05454 [Fonsecaea multimorphosa]